jgi:hypothetical protein
VEHVDNAGQEVTEAVARPSQEKIAWKAIKNNPKTVLWCVYALRVLTLSSYDNQAGAIYLSVQQFRKDFGYLFEGSYVLYAKWQSHKTGHLVHRKSFFHPAGLYCLKFAQGYYWGAWFELYGGSNRSKDGIPSCFYFNTLRGYS